MKTHARISDGAKARPYADRGLQGTAPVDAAVLTEDRRPEAALHRSLQALADRGPQASRLRAIQAMAEKRVATAGARRREAERPDGAGARSEGGFSPPGPGIAQFKPLTEKQQEQLPSLRLKAARSRDLYEMKKGNIRDIMAHQYGAAIDGEDVSYFLETYDKFFASVQMRALRAESSQAAFQNLRGKMTRWDSQLKPALEEKYKEIIGVVSREADSDKELVREQRDNLTSITERDEQYFRWYLKQSRPKKVVYRGDGRDVGADFLNGFAFKPIPPGGTRDISFFGVVQHTHSSANKNGMVSTTTDREQAQDWATSGHNHGVVYEMEVSNYIDVAALLAARNFKNRFAAQLEILIPGQIPASEVKTVVLYGKGGELGRKTNS